MSTSRCLPVFALFLVVLGPPSAAAWSNGGYSADPNNPDYGTHDWIADKALAMQTRDVTFLKTTYHAKFLLGTEAPDNTDYIGDATNHHVYFDATHQLEDDACAVRASDLYETALTYLRAGNYEVAAYDIGTMVHYVADPGVFGHTMGAYTDWGSEIHHSDYENEFEDRLGALPSPTSFALGDLDAYNATILLAEDITFGSGNIIANTWMDANYNWAENEFYASAIASLNRTVKAVADAINHLMTEAGLVAPSPPGAVTAVRDGADVVLSWQPPQSNGGAIITGYRIFTSTDPDYPIHVAAVGGAVLTWMHEDAQKGRTHYYWIVAENPAGQSDMSQAVSINVPSESNPLLLPAVISAISLGLAALGALVWRRRTRN